MMSRAQGLKLVLLRSTPPAGSAPQSRHSSKRSSQVGRRAGTGLLLFQGGKPSCQQLLVQENRLWLLRKHSVVCTALVSRVRAFPHARTRTFGAVTQPPADAKDPAPGSLEALIWHPTDTTMKPIVGNRRIQRPMETAYGPSLLPFKPLVRGSSAGLGRWELPARQCRRCHWHLLLAQLHLLCCRPCRIPALRRLHQGDSSPSLPPAPGAAVSPGGGGYSAPRAAGLPTVAAALAGRLCTPTHQAGCPGLPGEPGSGHGHLPRAHQLRPVYLHGGERMGAAGIAHVHPRSAALGWVRRAVLLPAHMALHAPVTLGVHGAAAVLY